MQITIRCPGCDVRESREVVQSPLHGNLDMVECACGHIIIVEGWDRDLSPSMVGEKVYHTESPDRGAQGCGGCK